MEADCVGVGGVQRAGSENLKPLHLYTLSLLPPLSQSHHKDGALAEDLLDRLPGLLPGHGHTLCTKV